MYKKKKLIVVAGPTAIGKTALAVALAKHYATEIVSADSRQFYKEMNIGTARPSDEELAGAVHHFIATHSVTELYSAGDFENDALETISGIFEKHDHAVLAGGSGLFIQAVTEGFDALPKADQEVRERLNTLFQEQGLSGLGTLLQTLDPEYYHMVDINNPQRLIRALEVCMTTGKTFSSFRQNNLKERPFQTIKIALNAERDYVYDRINKRVDMMIEAGLIEEVKGLQQYSHLNALNTVGYSEIFDYLNGDRTLQEAIDAVKQNTRRFAKRQLTWLRRDHEYRWFDPSQLQEIIDYIDA